MFVVTGDIVTIILYDLLPSTNPSWRHAACASSLLKLVEQIGSHMSFKQIKSCPLSLTSSLTWLIISNVPSVHWAIRNENSSVNW